MEKSLNRDYDLGQSVEVPVDSWVRGRLCSRQRLKNMIAGSGDLSVPD